VAAISFVTLLSEIAFTKVISYVLFYPFTYLLIGLALLGLGIGAAWVAFREEWQWTPDRAANCLVGFAFASAIALLALAYLPLDLTNILGGSSSILTWLALVVSLASPFVSSGVMLSTAFRTRTVQPGILYAADLSSAALASLAAIPVLVLLGPVRALMLVALIAIGTGLFLAGTRTRMLIGGAVILLHGFLWVNHLSAFHPAPGKSMADLLGSRELIYSAWHPLFRIDVSSEWRLPSGLVRRDIWHDGNLGSGFIHIPEPGEGTWGDTTTIKQIPFLVTDHPSVLVIGAAGGGDLAIAEHYGARHVTGVELHPITTRLLRGRYAEFTDRLVFKPNVEYVNTEGRRFVSLTPEKYDLIQLVNPDSYSAQPGASQVLVENYLYTREAFRAYWDALSPTGTVAIEIGDNRAIEYLQNQLRTISQARALLDEVGVAAPEKHLLVVESEGFLRVSNIFISRVPFPADTVRKLEEKLQGTSLRIAWNPYQPERNTPRALLASGGDLRDLSKFGLGEMDLRPVSDDRPFFFTYYKWIPLLRGDAKWGVAREYASGQYLLLLLLGISGAAVVIALLLPLLFRRREVPLPRIWSMGAAVAILGWAFLAIEINTIQHLTLYLGYPTYSLTAVLSGILLGAGVGSAWSSRVGGVRSLQIGAICVVGVAAATGAVLPRILEATFSLPTEVRASIAVIWSIAQGFGLGVFFPTALRILGDWGARWVAWGWTVNGTASVFGSALAVFIAMLVGFRYGALLAAVGYVVAAVLLARLHTTHPIHR